MKRKLLLALTLSMLLAGCTDAGSLEETMIAPEENVKITEESSELSSAEEGDVEKVNEERTEGEMTELKAEEQSGIDPITLDNAYQRAAFLADQVYQANGSNTLVSPLSLEMALGLAAEGASGETAVAQSLRSEKKEAPEDSEESWYYDSKYSFCYEIANSIWVREGDQLAKEYREVAEDKFQAEAANVDFEREPKATADRINSWCKERTHEMIPEIVSPEMFTNELQAILMNTVYFESPWRDKWGLREHEFTGLSGETTTQEMLADTLNVYYENEFIGILPKQEGDFSISGLDLKSLLDSRNTEYDVKAIAPKLDFDSTASNIVEILKAQGLTKMFDVEFAEFDRLVEGQELHVSNILQKCKLELDEEGTRAAAVTAMMMATNSVSVEKERKVREVYLDRPFAFLIYDNTNDQIVFVGKVTEL